MAMTVNTYSLQVLFNVLFYFYRGFFVGRGVVRGFFWGGDVLSLKDFFTHIKKMSPLFSSPHLIWHRTPGFIVLFKGPMESYLLSLIIQFYRDIGRGKGNNDFTKTK